MSTILWAVIGCGVIALLYGIVTASRVMASDAGTPRMQEIAQAVQEGAAAYLRRQYTTIGIVGVVVLIVLAILLGKFAAIGFLIGAVLSGAAINNITASSLDELVVTDTIPLSDAARACGRIRQLGVAELLAETIRRIALGESVSTLYVD